MPDDVLPTPDEDTAPPPDPFEAELVAYLDGELDPVAARRVEARLASDPEARAKAAALKKTFDLLDYLPRPEPSPTFTTRTLERLPAMKSGPAPVSQAPQPAVVVPATASSPSASVPVGFATAAAPTPPEFPTRWGLWVAGLLVASTACAAAGYFASAFARPYLFPAPREAADLPISDYRVVENLYLYAPADDLEFVRELEKPDFFGDEPALAADPLLRPQVVEPDKPSAAAFDRLAERFKAMPAPRQQAIRELDKQLHALAPATRDRLFRVLEVYAAWLDRLPEADRRQVLAAETPRRRLEEVRKVRNEQWLDALPSTQREKLKDLPAAQQAELIKQWKDEEAARREYWGFVRRHVPEIAANKTPWPFDTEDGRREVVEFVRAAFRTDDEKKSRLTENEFNRHKNALTVATMQGGGAWYAYGREALILTRKYEAYFLPEPAVGEPVTHPNQLPKLAERFFTTGGGAKAVQDKVGKWPDFALTVHNYPIPAKFDKLPPLGPARPAEFKEPLRSFVTDVLRRKLTLAESKALDEAEGQWPKYPREVVRLAKEHDLSAPGLMLPGSPTRWEAMYGFGPRAKP